MLARTAQRLTALCLISLCGCGDRGLPRVSYRFRSVAVGGGGYVTGILIHPRVPARVYIRTDVGGAYRWRPERAAWSPLLDGFGRRDWHLYGVESLAADPQDPDILYAALGKYLPRPWLRRPSGVYKSSDAGQTWRPTGLSLPMGGNEDLRWVGERLAVDPLNRQIVYFGSRLDGLWRSRDGGATWARVASFPTRGAPEGGISFVVLDPRAPGPGGASRALYIGALGEGVYFSDDAGARFRKLPFAALRAPQRAALASDGTLYVAGAGSSGAAGVVARWQRGAWTDITPPGRWDYGAISVSATDPRVVMAAPTTDDFPTPIFRSIDGGQTWAQVSFVREPEAPWWPARFWTGHTSSLAIDPRDPRRVYYTDYYGTWRTDDITATPSRWRALVRGHEETEPFVLRSPPVGAPLLSGMADVDGFRHESLERYPAQRMSGPLSQDGDVTGLDYCAADGNVVVRVGEERGGPFRGATSVDNGVTWTPFPTLPFPGARSGRVAVSATECQLSVWVPQNAVPYRTTDRGRTWTRSRGAPDNAINDRWNYSHPLAADAVDGARFYLYLAGAFYRSDDGGARWHKTAALPGPSFDPRAGSPGPSVKALPGGRGQVFVCLHDGGLWRSQDGGASFRPLAGVQLCQVFGFGRPPPGGTVPTLFIYGTVRGQEGIFRSGDLGGSYVRIDTPAQPIGDQAMVMEGDPRVFGRVYVGTNGRGTFYGEPL